MAKESIKTLFVDIGGVLLSNGWDHTSRQLACKHFNLDYQELDKRHNLVLDTYETGKISLQEYLKEVVFYQTRSFSIEQFQAFMFEQSKPFEDTINMLIEKKHKYGLKIIALSNEGRELTEYRLKKFHLNQLFDFFICSCFVGIRKPDPAIYKLAIDLAQVLPSNAIYIEDRALYVQAGESAGIQAIQHTDALSTNTKLAAYGL